MSNEDLDTLLALAKDVKMTDSDRHAQRVSFAYGNTKIENDHITRATVEEAARKITPEK